MTASEGVRLTVPGVALSEAGLWRGAVLRGAIFVVAKLETKEPVFDEILGLAVKEALVEEILDQPLAVVGVGSSEACLRSSRRLDEHGTAFQRGAVMILVSVYIR
jgi:hypothetical protein